MILVAVINWNGWEDTIVCLESLLRLSGPPFTLVVCENGSTDDSALELTSWLTRQGGDVQTGTTARFVYPSGERADVRGFAAASTAPAQALYLLQLTRNAGYAGGINRCVQWGRQVLGADTFWLLNNDIRADRQALCELVSAVRSSTDVGLCGSVLLDWDRPDSIQALGGRYNRAMGVGWHTRTHKNHDARQAMTGDLARQGLLRSIDYPVGASLLVTARYLDEVGLMDESYFLYYEEMDWVERGRAFGFRPAVALGSLVEHKEGASTGSHGGVRQKSLLSEHYGVVNRLRITRKLWPQYLPTVWLSLWLVALDRLVHGEWARAKLVVSLMFRPVLWWRSRMND